MLSVSNETFLLTVIMLTVIMLSGIMLSVVVQNVVVPSILLPPTQLSGKGINHKLKDTLIPHLKLACFDYYKNIRNINKRSNLYSGLILMSNR